jgi:hypothetical protein
MTLLRCYCTIFGPNLFFNFCELVSHHGRLVLQIAHEVTPLSHATRWQWLSLPGDVGFPPGWIPVKFVHLRSAEVSAFCGSKAEHFTSAYEVERWQQAHCVQTVLHVHTIWSGEVAAGTLCSDSPARAHNLTTTFYALIHCCSLL